MPAHPTPGGEGVVFLGGAALEFIAGCSTVFRTRYADCGSNHARAQKFLAWAPVGSHDSAPLA